MATHKAIPGLCDTCKRGIYIEHWCSSCGATPEILTHTCGTRCVGVQAFQRHVYGVVGNYSATPICHGTAQAGGGLQVLSAAARSKRYRQRKRGA